MFYIFPAMAQEAGASAGKAGFDLMGLIPFALIILVMYVFMLRPQQKKMKQHQEMVAALRRGDRVLTAGGLIGVVHKISSDTEFIIALEEGLHARMVKSAVTQVLSKIEPHVSTDEKEEKTTAPEEKAPKKPTSRKKAVSNN